MGSNAELLSKRLKRFGLDTVIIWLILAKVTYEFIHYFPYQILSGIPIPLVQWIAGINNDLINLIKNIAVLGFFVLLLIIIGIYEIRKYAKELLKPKEEVILEAKEKPYEELPIEKPEEIVKESEATEDTETFISDERDTENNNSEEP